jgi:hypothetical protein
VFPKISAGAPRLPLFGRAAALTLGFGLVLSVVVNLFASRLITLISGPAYLSAADYAAGFVLLGTGLALTHLAMVTSIAIGERRFGTMTWAAAAVELVVISLWAHGGIGEILLVSLAVTFGLAVAGAVVTLSHRAAVSDGQDKGIFAF